MNDDTMTMLEAQRAAKHYVDTLSRSGKKDRGDLLMDWFDKYKEEIEGIHGVDANEQEFFETIEQYVGTGMRRRKANIKNKIIDLVMQI